MPNKPQLSVVPYAHSSATDYEQCRFFFIKEKRTYPLQQFSHRKGYCLLSDVDGQVFFPFLPSSFFLLSNWFIWSQTEEQVTPRKMARG